MADRQLVFDREFLEELSHWVRVEPRKALRILALVAEISRDPFKGTGKPEQLRYFNTAQWSRRIDEEHRLTHRVFEDRVEFLHCRHHYGR